jgi:3-methyladenine DNA glycosylase/8-oxoguanine DNA glycosylase
VRGDIDLRGIGRLADEAVIERLVTVRGIGRWTAQMFLISSLHRADVWPTGDLGVRAGYAVAFERDEVPSATELEALGDGFRPHRTVVAWWCWRALEASRSAS